MSPTTEDPNRLCWNCKHFAPDDRATSILGDCCQRSPRIVALTYAFPRRSGDSAWCGNWERTNITVPAIPDLALLREETNTIVSPTMENTVREINSFAEEHEIEIDNNLNKEELLAKVLEEWEAR